MADWGTGQGRGRVGTWDAAARRARTLVWAGPFPDFGRAAAPRRLSRPLFGAGLFPDFARAAAERLRNWAIADTGPGRLLPWLPVAFGLGIALYFTADREPAWWAGSGLAAFCCVIAFIARRRPIAFPVALAFTAVAAGFAVATLKSVQVAHPIL